MTEQLSDEEEKRLLLDILDLLEQLDDPVERAKAAGRLLASYPSQRTRLREIRQAAVVKMRARKMSHRAIARVLRISAARVQRLEAAEHDKKEKPTDETPAE